MSIAVCRVEKIRAAPVSAVSIPVALRKRTSTRFSARIIVGSVPAADMPGFIKPQLAILKLKAPAGERWIHEIKYDGYRVQVHVDRGRVRVFTRSGLDWTKKFHLIAESFEGLPIDRAIFDGEVVVIKDGRTDFGALQAELAAGRQRSIVLYLFDLLFLDGFDLRKSPQLERKRILKSLYDETGMKEPLLYSEHLDTDGQAMFEAAAKLNWEGIISKRVDAPYRSDRNEGWLKIKCSQRGRRPSGAGSAAPARPRETLRRTGAGSPRHRTTSATACTSAMRPAPAAGDPS